MKGNGLSSTSRNILRKANRQSAAFVSGEKSYLAGKERMKSLRLQAEKAQLERAKRDSVVSADNLAPSTVDTSPRGDS
jgi:hypothetical protein